jgi:predicted AAA+ superfamily ATPase
MFPIPFYLPRNFYIEKIKPFINKAIIKILTGYRRVGKSYLMYQLMDEIQKIEPNCRFIYINKELQEFRFMKTDADLLDFIKQKKSDTGKTYLFIDEVQEIINFEIALRSLLAENCYDIYCTGSNAGMLSGDLATHLTGRYIEIKIYPLSYPEFLQFHQFKNDEAAFRNYILFGGMPFLRNLQLDELVSYEYLRNIYNTVILKDVVQRYHIRNFSLLENLIRFLCDNIGNILSAKNISDFHKSQGLDYSVKMILEYLIYIENSYLINRAKRMDLAGKKIFEIGEKYYITDVGIRNSIQKFNQQDIGKVMENIVYQHLLIWGYKVFVGKKGDYEIDFIAQKNDKQHYIQVTFKMPDEKTYMREFGNLLKIQDNYPKWVVSMDEFAGIDYQGIKHIHIREFLQNELR